MTCETVSFPVFFETHNISPPHIMKKIREKKKKEKTEATAVSRADDVGRLPNEEVRKFHQGDYQLRKISRSYRLNILRGTLELKAA